MGNYLTVAEYKNAPTAADVANLVAGGNQAAQDAALATRIAMASGWIDGVIDQTLIASSYTELIRTRYLRDGSLSLHPRRNPLNQLVALSIGSNGSDMVSVPSLASCFVDQQQWIIPFAGGAIGWPVSLGAGSRLGQVLAQLTSVSGYPNTTLTSTLGAPGASSFTVASSAGFTPQLGSECIDQTITIYDGASTEVVNVTSVIGTTINCSALAFGHSVGVCVSGLPADVKGVAVDVTTAYLRTRSSESMVMQNTLQGGVNSGWDAPRSSLLANAKMVLANYMRIR